MTTTDAVPDLGDSLVNRLPPAEWFEKPPDGWNPVDDPNAALVHVTFTGPERGRFAALVAPFDACLLDGKEASGCFPTPRAADGYGYSHIGTSMLADGTRIKTANIGGGINHADRRWRDNDQVLDRYANTASRIAAVRYIDSDELGGVVALGSVVPGVTVAQALEAMQSALSGDWRLVREIGGYRFIGSQLVNVPGFRPWQLGKGKVHAITAAVARATVVQSEQLAVAAACGCVEELPQVLTIEWEMMTMREQARRYVLAHPGHGSEKVHGHRGAIGVDDANAWSADSKIPGPLYHGTNAANAATIERDGWHADAARTHSGNLVQGVFLTRKREYARTYGDSVVEARARVRKVASFDDIQSAYRGVDTNGDADIVSRRVTEHLRGRGFDAAEFGDQVIVFGVDDVRPVTHAVTAGTSQLRQYWVSGKGASKIRWGTDGSFRRCVSQLSKYVGRPEGLCAKYHKAATGEWPAEKGVQSSVTATVDAHGNVHSEADGKFVKKGTSGTESKSVKSMSFGELGAELKMYGQRTQEGTLSPSIKTRREDLERLRKEHANDAPTPNIAPPVRTPAPGAGTKVPTQRAEIDALTAQYGAKEAKYQELQSEMAKDSFYRKSTYEQNYVREQHKALEAEVTPVRARTHLLASDAMDEIHAQPHEAIDPNRARWTDVPTNDNIGAGGSWIKRPDGGEHYVHRPAAITHPETEASDANIAAWVEYSRQKNKSKTHGVYTGPVRDDELVSARSSLREHGSPKFLGARDRYVVADAPTLEMNAALRGEIPHTAGTKRRASEARNIITAGTTDHDTILHRTMELTPETASSIKPGQAWVSRGFQSTQTGGPSPYDRTHATMGTVHTRMQVRTPAGTHAGDVGYGEIVLRPGKMRVVSSQWNRESKDKPGVLDVVVEYEEELP